MKYTAYLLRLWQDREGIPWRATIENPRTHERSSFATLPDLIAFLEAETGETVEDRPAGPRIQPNRNSTELY